MKKTYKKHLIIFFLLFLLGISYLALRGDAETRLSREIYKIETEGKQIDPKDAFALLTKYNISVITVEKIAYTLNKFGFSKKPIESYQLLKECTEKQIKNSENCKVSLRFLEAFMQIARINTPMCGLNSGDIVLYSHSSHIDKYEVWYGFNSESGWSYVGVCDLDEKQNDLTALTVADIRSEQIDQHNDTEIISVLGRIDKLKIETDDNKIAIEKYTQYGTSKSQYSVNNQREVKFLNVVDGIRY